MHGINRIQQRVFLIMGVIIFLLTGILIYREYSWHKNVQTFEQDKTFEQNGRSIIIEKNGKGSSNDKDDKDDEAQVRFIKIYITGQVKNPGVIELAEGSRLADAVELAGGVLPTADLSRINLAMKVKDEGMYYILADDETMPDDIQVPLSPQNPGSQEAGKININTATQGELETLTGIGPSRAKRIIEYREKNGGFKNIEEIMNISGIGEKIFEGIREEICVQ